jgi:hypothetical protein
LQPTQVRGGLRRRRFFRRSSFKSVRCRSPPSGRARIDIDEPSNLVLSPGIEATHARRVMHFVCPSPPKNHLEPAFARNLKECHYGAALRRRGDVPTVGGRGQGMLFENSPAGEKRGAIRVFSDRKKISALVIEQDPAAVARDDRPNPA